MPYRNVDKSMKLFERACELIPGGTQLISRRPTRFACGVSPVYADRACGSRFWDIDGNEYIDWVSGIGAIILGYCDGAVDNAVCEQISKETMYSINHELEVELAEELVNTIPCAEWFDMPKEAAKLVRSRCVLRGALQVAIRFCSAAITVGTIGTWLRTYARTPIRRIPASILISFQALTPRVFLSASSARPFRFPTGILMGWVPPWKHIGARLRR